MINGFLIALAMTAPQGEMTGDEIISKTLAKYSAASTFSGEFRMIQTAQNKQVTIDTKVAAEKPNKIFISQSSDSVEPKNWLVAGDGTKFVYDSPWKPGSVFTRQRISEPLTFVDKADGQPKVLKLNDILIATKRSLGDPISPFLEFSLQSPESMTSLRAFVKRLAKLKKGSDKALEDGTSVYSITGLIQFGVADMAQKGITVTDDYSAVGKFEMLITKDFDLREVKINETMAISVPDSNLPVQVSVVTRWVGKIDLGAKPDQSLFNPR
jgi:hypothetical protein